MTTDDFACRHDYNPAVTRAQVRRPCPLLRDASQVPSVARVGLSPRSQNTADVTPPPQAIAGGTMTVQYATSAPHVGDCAFYVSYDWDKPRSQMQFFKFANVPDCKSRQLVDIQLSLPPWLPAGNAVLRWDWYALHVTVRAFAHSPERWPTCQSYSLGPPCPKAHSAAPHARTAHEVSLPPAPARASGFGPSIARSVVIVRQGVIRHGACYGRFLRLHFLPLPRLLRLSLRRCTRTAPTSACKRVRPLVESGADPLP